MALPSKAGQAGAPPFSAKGPSSADIVAPAGLLLLVLACLAWPLLFSVPAPVGGDVLQSDLPPFFPGHFLGTDDNGNDVWSRLVYGGRSSLLIALAVNLVGMGVGGSLGAVSAYAGGWVDAAITRVLDVFLAFPSLILVIAVGQAMQPSRANTIWALAFFSVPAFGRIARSATLQLRNQPFIIAAGLSGTRSLRLLVTHIAPNIFPRLATFALLGMGLIVNIEGAVSYLGLGVPLPQPSWGNMIYQGQMALAVAPHLVLLPSAFLFVTILAFNLLSEALRQRYGTR